MMRKFSPWILFIISMFILQSCSSTSSEGDSERNTNPNLVSKEIGPSGGEIQSKDGKLTLEFPEGALGSMETITIEEINPENLASEFDSINVERAWELGPDGLEFSVPANVTITTDQNPVIGDSISVQPQAVYLLDQDRVFPLDSILVEADLVDETVQIKALLSHFSPLVLEAALDPPFIEIPREFFRVENVPEERKVGNPWIINITIKDIFSMGHLSDRPDFTGLLIDQSSSPVALTDPSISDMIPLNSRVILESEGKEHFGSVEYTCTEPGSGTFSMTSEWLNAGFVSPVELPFEQRARVKQKINCLPVPQKTLTVNFTGNGTGRVVSDPEGIDCTTEEESCSSNFDEGTEVILTANPSGDSSFCGWDTGADTESSETVKLILDRNATITACFEKQESQTADVGINLSGPDNPVKPDEKSNLEVTVKNDGPDDVPPGETSIMLEFSEGLDFEIPEDDEVTCEASANQITCVPKSDDPFSAESEITFVTEFTCQSSSNSCTISGDVQTPLEDTDPENNMDEVVITVNEDGSINPKDIEGQWLYNLNVVESTCYTEDLTPDTEITLVDEENGTLEIAFDLILDPKVTGNVEQDGAFSGETPWIHTQDDLDFKFILEGMFEKNNQDFTFSGTMLNEIRDSESLETTCSRTYNAEGEKKGN